MSNQARIHTKLTADGSELTRALQKGIDQSTSMATRMSGLGKSIGAAFSAAAIIGAMRSFYNAQVTAVKGFQDLEKSADAFANSLENLDEKLSVAGLGGGKGGVGRVLTDYRQQMRAIATEMRNIQELENLSGISGVFKSLEDAAELFASGRLMTVDEAAISQMSEQLDALGKAYEKAQAKAKKLVQDQQSALRESLKQFDFERQMSADIASGEVPIIQAYKEAAEEVAQSLRNAFAGNPDPAILAQLKETVSIADELGRKMQEVQDKAAKADFDWAVRMAEMDREVSTSSPSTANRAYSQMRSIGLAAKDIGAAREVKSQEAKMIAIEEKQLAALNAVKAAIEKLNVKVF